MAAPSCLHCSTQSRGAFASLDAAQFARLARARVPHTYEAGQFLYYQGNPALAVYCVHEGRIKLTRLAASGDEHVIATRGPGDIAGYRSVLVGEPYRASAQSLERTVACAIPRESFLELVHDHSQLPCALLVRLSRDSFRIEDHLMARALEQVRTRLARFLLQRIPADPKLSRGAVVVPLRMRRIEIAQLIDTTPETLSRALNTLAERGVIEPRRQDVRVLNMATLVHLARLGHSFDTGKAGPE